MMSCLFDRSPAVSFDALEHHVMTFELFVEAGGVAGCDSAAG
jgi:hypothetical protein